MNFRNKGFDIVLNDIWQIIKRNKKPILLSTLCLALTAFSWSLTRDVLYVGEATFRDKAKADSGLRQSVTDLFFGAASERNDSEAISAFKSSRLMEALIVKMGLQADVKEKGDPFPLLNTLWRNLGTEWAYLMGDKTPSLPQKKKGIALVDIKYEQEVSLPLDLTFLDEEIFQVKGGTEGVVGEVYSGDNFRFILQKAGREPLEGREFHVVLKPLKHAAKEAAGAIVAKTSVDDTSLIKIKGFHEDRFEAALFVNTLMRLYQDFLKEEHDRIADAQLQFLEKRENERGQSLKRAMEEHTSIIEKDIASSGFTESKQELEFLSGQLAQANQKLLEIELHQRRLKKVSGGQCASFDQQASHLSDAHVINAMLERLRELKIGQDTLQMALAGKLLDRSAPEEFYGMTLTSAKEIYIALVKDRHENEAVIRQLDAVVKELDTPDFEVTSLTAVLKDPVSHEKIMKASNLSHTLKDTANRTQRELERIREELRVQKEFLKTHLSETSHLLQIKGELLNEKYFMLQVAMLEMTVREKAILEKQIDDYIAVRLGNLETERAMVEEHGAKIKERLAKIPQKWMHEQLLEQSRKQAEQLAETIGSMVETKNISNNLELVQSSPLDYAVPPLHPKRPHLILLTLLGAFLGAFFSSSFFVSKALLTELPLTLDNLALNGFKTAGALNFQDNEPLTASKGNLDTLRRALAYLPAHHFALIALTASGPNFSLLLAELLRKKGESVLLLSLNPDSDTSTEGLKAVLEEGIELEAVLKNDTLAFGGRDPYFNELLVQSRFQEILAELKHRYSWILASSSVPLSSTEAENLISLFDGALIAIGNETYQELSHLLGDLETLRREKPIAFLKLHSTFFP